MNSKKTPDSANPTTGIRTSITNLDAVLSPLQPRQSCVMASGLGEGKSALALQIVLDAVFHQGKKAIFFTLGPSSERLVERMFAHLSSVNIKNVISGDQTPDELQRIRNTAWRLKKVTGRALFVQEHCFDIADISNRCRKEKADSGLDLVVVDPVELIDSGFRNLPRNGADEHFRQLKQTALDLNVSLIVLARLDDDGTFLRCERIDQETDVLLKLVADADGNSESDKKILIVRPGNDATRPVTVPVRFEGEYMRFIPREQTEA